MINILTSIEKSKCKCNVILIQFKHHNLKGINSMHGTLFELTS